MSGRYCTTCGEMDYSENGDMPCLCGMPEPEPERDIFGECESYGHPYHGDEYDPEQAPPDQREQARDNAGRCYCGAVRYPAGGPKVNV